MLQLKADITAKSGFPVGTLQFVRQFAEDGVTPTEWVSHWDNTNRIRISMHQDVMETLRANPAFEGLAAKFETMPAKDDRESYDKFTIITPKHLEMAF